MATHYWTGTTSTDPTVATNWRDGSVPEDGDQVMFSGEFAVKNCIGDLTAGGTVFLQHVSVDGDFYHSFALGSAATRLTVSAASFYIDAAPTPCINLDGEGGTSPYYLFLKNAGMGDINTEFIVSEPTDYPMGHCPPSAQLRHYDIKGYAKNVRFLSMHGTGFMDGEIGGTLKWANSDEDGAKTGFETLKYEGATIPLDGYTNIVQLGPWGSNPATITSMEFKFAHCVKTYLADLGSVKIDADIAAGHFTNLHIFNEEWTPQVPTSAECTGSYTPLTGLGAPQGTDRATASVTVDSLPDDGDSFDVGSSFSFIFDDDVDANTSRATAADKITVAIGSITTTSGIATEIIKAINGINQGNQKNLGAGTKNQYCNFEAYNSSDPDADDVVNLRMINGGVDTTAITQTGTSLTLTDFSGGSTSTSTSSPFTVPVQIDKLEITSQSTGTNYGADLPCLPISWIDRAQWNLGFVDIYVPSEIDRLEMSASTAGSAFQVGAYLAFHDLGPNEHHVIHDGFYDGGYIDLINLHDGCMIIDHGQTATPSGGLQWRTPMDIFNDAGKTECWQIAWPKLGCTIYIDDADLSENSLYD